MLPSICRTSLLGTALQSCRLWAALLQSRWRALPLPALPRPALPRPSLTSPDRLPRSTLARVPRECLLAFRLRLASFQFSIHRLDSTVVDYLSRLCDRRSAGFPARGR